jgi:tetrahydromethanopterin S-methyltransferase subunit G
LKVIAMAEQIAELTFDLLKKVHHRMELMDHKVDELKAEMQAMRGNLISMLQDIHNIYGILTRHDTRLDRIESRLELSEPIPT